LLLEKDTTLSRYQDLLKTERQENAKSYDDFQNQMKALKSTISDLEAQMSAKDAEVQTLKRNLRETELKISTSPPAEPENDDAKLLDELYQNDADNFELKISEQTVEIESLRHKLHEGENELRKLQHQLRDACNREKLWEKTISDKEQEIEMMREKLSVGAKPPAASQQQEIIEINENIVATREIEQLQEILEERDRHIGDLTDTLAHFHDDQQKFLTDTTLQTAEQVSQLSADLNRCEATNRVMRTQVEALKRQIVAVEQREKQARELVKSLKTQLIRRPVISMKSDRIFSTLDDQAQRKAKQLEAELADAKEELRKQAGVLEMRRNKSATDLGLWDKQKRWQQSAEKLKQKLTEREGELEKLKSLNNSAKTTIARLEREKHILEQRTRGLRCCGSASCPNLASGANNKYTPAESPESYTSTTDSETVIRGGSSASLRSKTALPENREIIESLKARIEAQQRRIVAMELEGKGSNAITHEMEKLQERLSALEAQNIRLEAKNLQLQLDSDRTRQTDAAAERLKRQIKHLEE
jgi:centrosomal protein CEP290